MKGDVKGTVVDAGGGEIRILVDRETQHYPEVGKRVRARVLLWGLPRKPKDGA